MNGLSTPTPPRFGNASGSPPAIRIRGLCIAFGAKKVLTGLDLDVAHGRSLVVIGELGSGKSVLLKCILGLLTPDAGVIEIKGRDVLQMRQADREVINRQIGMLFQAGALFDSMPVWQNVVFGLEALHHMDPSEARRRADAVLVEVGLAPSVGDLAPAELSGGMKKRVALARAIAARPQILMFDEPTTGLDPIMAATIDGLIVDCVKRLGCTALTITHDMASAARIGDRAAMLYEGKIVWEGAASALLASGDPLVDQFTHGRQQGPVHPQNTV